MNKEITAEQIHQEVCGMKVFLFNVGQGDHILIKFEGGEYGIIDFHYDTEINSGFEPPALIYFKQLQKTMPQEEFEKITIAFICISHADSDHVKGINDTTKWFNENNLFIKNYWMGCARSETDLKDFIMKRIPGLLKQSSLDERAKILTKASRYEKEMRGFFKNFDFWKEKKVKNKRYKNQSTGLGEYPVGIRSLDNPSLNTKVVNLAPLSIQLDNYHKQLPVDVLKKILGLKEQKLANRNYLSHVLWFKYRQKNLLFGGDTDIEVWEECLSEFEREETDFVSLYGDFRAQFIKASHHGSKNSSNFELWKRLVTSKGSTFVGISAGTHASWLHPDSETLSHIRKFREDTTIAVTNICNTCLMRDESFEKEAHVWYDNFISADYKGSNLSTEAAIVEHMIAQAKFKEKGSEEPRLGLLAYVFDVPTDNEGEITMKIALAKNVLGNGCIYKDHEETLTKHCRLAQ